MPAGHCVPPDELVSVHVAGGICDERAIVSRISEFVSVHVDGGICVGRIKLQAPDDDHSQHSGNNGVSSIRLRNSAQLNDRPRPATEVRLGRAFFSMAKERSMSSGWFSRNQRISCFFDAGQ